jgi:beta-galactosidase GanA
VRDFGQMNESLAKAGAATCDFLTMPMRWVDLEPVEGKYNFATTDRWIEWAVRTAKLPLVGGPVVDLRPRSAPDWLFIWENDYDTLRDLVFEHIQAVVTRYRKTISRWTVASGLHVNTNFKISFEQILDLTRLSVMLIKKLHPTARVQLELQQPWGEYLVQNKRSIPPYVYAEAVLTTQLPIDAIALRLQRAMRSRGLRRGTC